MRYYTYKVTFKDLLGYFYYGKHKENGRPYYGTPTTWKHLWDQFEPEVQILQWYSTQGEVDGAETAIILSTWKDKYSLNESVGLRASEESCSKGGKKSGPINGKRSGPANAIANFTPDMLSDNGKKTGSMNAVANLIPNCSANGKNFPPEIRSNNGTKTGKRILLTEIATGNTYEFPSAHEAARVLGLNRGHLSSVALGKVRQHKGYIAKYTHPE